MKVKKPVHETSRIALGMSEKKLLELCDDAKIKKSFLFPPYWPTEIYGFGKSIRESASYPKLLPLCIYLEHGISFQAPYKHELETTAPAMFYYSKETVQKFQKISNKPCYPLISPFVSYRQRHKLKKKRTAKGTLAFPAHTTPSLTDVSNIEEYIQQLLALPKAYQPVTVCMHYHDINKKQYKLYQKYGIPVVTAGNSMDERFIDRFYELLSKYSYTTSNMIGSYTFYSVEMGIPFFIYGNQQKFVNKDDPNIPLGEYSIYDLEPRYREVYHLFYGPQKGIKKTQKEIVEKYLGLHNTISNIQLRKILYASFFTWIIRGLWIQWLGMFFKAMQTKIFGNRKS